MCVIVNMVTGANLFKTRLCLRNYTSYHPNNINKNKTYKTFFKFFKYTNLFPSYNLRKMKIHADDNQNWLNTICFHTFLYYKHFSHLHYNLLALHAIKTAFFTSNKISIFLSDKTINLNNLQVIYSHYTIASKSWTWHL